MFAPPLRVCVLFWVLRHFLFLLAFTATPWVGFAQSDGAANMANLAFRRIDNRNGLSHNSVYRLLQDRLGFIWIATEDGLNRYDGVDFVVYRSVIGDTASLWDNGITCLVEDPSGDLWVGTRRGLNRLDRETGTFVRYDAGHPTYIYSLTVDSLGGAWANAGSYLLRATKESRELVRVDPPISDCRPHCSTPYRRAWNDSRACG